MRPPHPQRVALIGAFGSNTTTCLDCYGMPLHIPARRGFADRFPSGAFDFALSPEGGASTPALSPSPSLPL